MDPFSITASVIAIVQAVGVAAKGVESAQKLWHSSQDFMILRNELNDLQCLLLQIRDIIVNSDEQDSSSTAALSHYVERLRDHIEQLNVVVAEITKKRRSSETENAGVSYRRWIRAKSRISLLRSNIVEARNNLSLAINTSLALQNRQMRRMLLHLQEVEFVGENTAHSVSEPGERFVTEISDESHDTVELEEWFDAPDVPIKTSDATQQSMSPPSTPWQSRFLELNNLSQDEVLYISGTIKSTDCDLLCACQCHIRMPLETLRWLRDLCGYLFMNHIAGPLLGRRRCNIPNCKQTGLGAFYMSHLYPAWLLRRMLVFSMTWKDLSGPGATWTVRMPRIVPYYAPIWESIRFDRVVVVRELLKTLMCSPYDIRQDGTNLLYHAFCFRRWDIARFVLSQGGGMDWEDEYGRTPLSVALIAYHSSESTQETKKEAYQFIGRSDITERLGFSPLHTAILQNNPEEIRQYLRMDPTNLNTQDNLGRTPLILACCHSNGDAARILLRFGADPNIKDRSMRCPIHYAAQRSLSIVQALMELSNEEQVARLLKTQDVRGRNALYFAIEFNRSEIFSYLCAQGVSLNFNDNLQRTLLHYAAWTGQADVMDVMSREDLSGIDVTELDTYEKTAEQCFTSLRPDVDHATKAAFQRLMAAVNS